MEASQALIPHPELYLNSNELIEEAELPSKHHMAARLDALGFSKREISKKLDMSESTIWAISKSPLFKSVVRRIKEDLDKSTTKAYNLLVEAAPKASETIIRIMNDSENERLQKEAAVDILKGTSVILHEDKSGSGLTLNISDSKIALIINTLKELK